MADLGQLRENEDELATALLPEDPPKTEALSARDQFLTHAYLVLATAVVEEFIEGCFETYVRNALDADAMAGCFVSLGLKFGDDVIGQLNKVPDANVARPILHGLYVSKVVRQNNGVRRKNLQALAKPL